jgi:hypothetical protein
MDTFVPFGTFVDDTTSSVLAFAVVAWTAAVLLTAALLAEILLPRLDHLSAACVFFELVLQQCDTIFQRGNFFTVFYYSISELNHSLSLGTDGLVSPVWSAIESIGDVGH